MKTHHLKTQAEAFERVLRGVKKCELRKDDRDFEIGDLLVLKEIATVHDTYTETGRWIRAKVTDIIKDRPYWGLMDGYVIMSIEVETCFVLPNSGGGTVL